MGPVRGLRDHVPMARPVRGLGAPEGDLGPIGPRRGHSLLSSRLNSARMAKRDLLRRKVEDIDISPSSEVARLVEAMGRGGGFTAKKIAVGVEILRTMFRRPACTTFLSFPAALMATGVRGVLRALVKEKLVDVVVTTCGTADHDLAWAWKNRIPVVVPAMFDGAVGYQLWSFWQEHKAFAIDQFRDEAELADLVFKAKETGALMIGGGVSKHHTIWWNQFRGGLDYAVYITTAPEWDGSLSGARVREGISWGKVKETAEQVTIEGDASAILPIMIAAALGRTHR